MLCCWIAKIVRLNLFLSLMVLPSLFQILELSCSDGEYRKRREDCEAALSIMQADSFRDLTIADLESSQDKLDERLFKRSRHAYGNGAGGAVCYSPRSC